MGHVPRGIALPLGMFVQDRLHRLLPGNVSSGAMADPVEAVLGTSISRSKGLPVRLKIVTRLFATVVVLVTVD